MEALELLVNKGADVSVIDNEGLTPMDVAKENQQDKCVEMLFKITQPNFSVRIITYDADYILSVVQLPSTPHGHDVQNISEAFGLDDVTV